MLTACQQKDDMPAWMLEDDQQQQEQQAKQAQRLRKMKARAKTTVFGSSQHSPRKQQKGAKGLAKAHARPPGSDKTTTGGAREANSEDADFMLDAWDSDAEETAAKRKASRFEHSFICTGSVVNKKALLCDVEGDT